MSLSGNIFGNSMHGFSHIFYPISQPPTLAPGQSAIYVSNGEIPGTTTDKFYFQSGSDSLSEIGAGAENGVNNGTNVGSGAQVFKDKIGSDLNFRTLTMGSNITINTDDNEIIISSTNTYEDISTSDVVNPNPDVCITDINLNTGDSAEMALNDSTRPLGFEKKMIVSRFLAGSSLILNITNFVNGSGIVFNNKGMSAGLVWTAGGWAISSAGADTF